MEFLVTEMGYSVLAMEASASAGQAIDAYVRHAIGGAGKVLTGLGVWIWRTVPLEQHLHERYGDVYYALGLLLGQGAFGTVDATRFVRALARTSRHH